MKVISSPVQIVSKVVASEIIGLIKTVTVLLVVEKQVLSVTVKSIVFIPPLFHLTQCGPFPVPGNAVPPLKFHVYRAVEPAAP